MKVTYVQGIRAKLIKIIKTAQEERKSIDFITLTQKEYDELREEGGAKPGQEVVDFVGVPIKVEESGKVIRKAFNH